MKEYKFTRINQDYHCYELDNGLKIVLVPDTSKNIYYASIGVVYGSNDLEFQVDKKNYKTPLGVAHFLEHKVFEMADGTDSFSFFNKSGTGSNAGTNYNSTRYYIWGSNDFKINFDYLFKMVFSPYFTDENVLKEQGIIAEEISMYDSEPDWIINDLIRKNTFLKSHYRDKIAGTKDEISKIDKDILNVCYENFYQPNNMCIIVAGNFNKDDVLDVYEENKKLLRDNHIIIRKKIKEPENVLKKEMILEMNVVNSRVCWNFKINKKKISFKNKVKLNMYLNCIFNSLLGNSSDFYEKIIDERIATYCYHTHEYYENYYILEINAETSHFKEFEEKLFEALERKPTEDDLRRAKKVWLAGEISILDHPDLIVEDLFEDYLLYHKFNIARKKIIDSLNYEELLQIYDDLDLSNNCCTKIIPRKGK